MDNRVTDSLITAAGAGGTVCVIHLEDENAKLKKLPPDQMLKASALRELPSNYRLLLGDSGLDFGVDIGNASTEATLSGSSCLIIPAHIYFAGGVCL